MAHTKDNYAGAISIEKANFLISNTRGRIFSVTFLKSNGDLREMTCRLGVRKGVTGAGLKFDPASRGLRVVHEFKSTAVEGGQRLTAETGFRMIPTGPRLLSLRVAGKAYGVLPPN